MCIPGLLSCERSWHEEIQMCSCEELLKYLPPNCLFTFMGMQDLCVSTHRIAEIAVARQADPNALYLHDLFYKDCWITGFHHVVISHTPCYPEMFGRKDIVKVLRLLIEKGGARIDDELKDLARSGDLLDQMCQPWGYDVDNPHQEMCRHAEEVCRWILQDDGSPDKLRYP